jgi:beta-aspartyl-peptidase (threonine type)
MLCAVAGALYVPQVGIINPGEMSTENSIEMVIWVATGGRGTLIGPIIGAGTYAKNGQCAVSATGSGEYFIRESAARQVCDRVAWNEESLADAANATIMAVGAIGGDGGLIAMGPDGHPAFAINDLGMYRGRVSAGASPQTAIFADEKWTN